MPSSPNERLNMLKRLAAVAALTVSLIGLSAPAYAGSPHFVGDPQASLSGSTLTVSGKEAGLGDEDQIRVEVTAEVACVNRGGHNPSAENKQTFAAGEDVPVQNGKADYTVTVPIEFQPTCSPPMQLVLLSGTVTDVTNGISATF
jgi:hypothetical protein